MQQWNSKCSIWRALFSLHFSQKNAPKKDKKSSEFKRTLEVPKSWSYSPALNNNTKQENDEINCDISYIQTNKYFSLGHIV